MKHKKLPSIEDIKKRIVSLPKWGWAVIGLCYLIGLIPGFTILIWMPGTGIMSILIGIAIVEYIQKKLSN